MEGGANEGLRPEASGIDVPAAVNNGYKAYKALD